MGGCGVCGAALPSPSAKCVCVRACVCVCVAPLTANFRHFGPAEWRAPRPRLGGVSCGCLPAAAAISAAGPKPSEKTNFFSPSKLFRNNFYRDNSNRVFFSSSSSSFLCCCLFSTKGKTIFLFCCYNFDAHNRPSHTHTELTGPYLFKLPRESSQQNFFFLLICKSFVSFGLFVVID